MRTKTYAQIKTLAADLAGRPRDKLPTSEAAMLRTFLAAELADLWEREAWPELCDHLEQITLDGNDCFSLREGDSDEIGRVLWIGDLNPLTNAGPTRLRDFTRLDDRVNVNTSLASVWVDWQTPAPDLMASAYDVEATLNAYTLPERFYLPLAWRGAALLLAEEDPQRAATYRNAADTELLKQAARIKPPWWRRF